MSDTAIPATAAQDVAVLRAWLYTYRWNRIGREAPSTSLDLAHAALDRLAGDAS